MSNLADDNHWISIYSNSASVSGSPGYENRLPEFRFGLPFYDSHVRVFAYSGTAPAHYQFAGRLNLFVGTIEDEAPLFVTQRKFVLNSWRLMYFKLELSTPYFLEYLSPYWLPDITLTVQQFQPLN